MHRAYRSSLIPLETPLAPRIGRESIVRVVDEFYDLVRTHGSLSVPFASVKDWPAHKAKIAGFWWQALGGARDPGGNNTFEPVAKHFYAGFTPQLLCDWLGLFEVVLRRQLSPGLADEWIDQARLLGDRLMVADSAYRKRALEEALK